MIKRDEIYELYWYFACERQKIFLKKLQNKPGPWTEDPILQQYKFCNAYRVNDRVSQYLLREVIYNGTNYSKEDTIFRIVLFKLFNKEHTWEVLKKCLGDPTLENFNKISYSKILSKIVEQKEAIFNDAYISCPTKVFGYDKKQDNFLALLEKMFLMDHVEHKIIEAPDMETAFHILKSYPLIGDFMSYQLVTDINYSEVVNWDECSFTKAGPGSKRGIKKCFIDTGGLSESEIIAWMCEHQEEELDRLNLVFPTLGGRKLQYIDIQNLFCEVDKYCREKAPGLSSNRTKIKKKYLPKAVSITYIYPPKWQITLS